MRNTAILFAVVAPLAACSSGAADDAGRDAPSPPPDAQAVGDVAAPVDVAAPIDAAPDAADDGMDAPADAAPMDVAAPDAADARPADARADAGGDSVADAGGPRVDRTNPRLHATTFTARDADPTARLALGTQSGYLDTRVAPRGLLVVYLHGAGSPTTCGSVAHAQLLASWGFHVLQPCYVSDYGVQNCGSDIAGCRLEAFDGVDRHRAVTITPPDSIETRVVRGLELLARRDPGGDWGYYLDGARPRWNRVVISGISHGASSSGVIAQVRPVERAVMLSGPLDSGQAWLSRAGMTPADRFWGFSHTADAQHSGHLAAFMALRLPGAPTRVDGAASPYGGSHRLISSATTTDGHGATQAGGPSPRDARGNYVYAPVWRRMYGAE